MRCSSVEWMYVIGRPDSKASRTIFAARLSEGLVAISGSAMLLLSEGTLPLWMDGAAERKVCFAHGFAALPMTSHGPASCGITAIQDHPSLADRVHEV